MKLLNRGLIIFFIIDIFIIIINYRNDVIRESRIEECKKSYSSIKDNKINPKYILDIYDNLKKKNIYFFYYNEKEKKYIKSDNFYEINLTLQSIIDKNRDERAFEYKNSENNKKRVIGNTFGLTGYDKNSYIIVPRELENKIFKNSYDKFYYQSTRCKLMINLLEL